MSDVLPNGGEGTEDAEDVHWADGARPGDILQVTVPRLQGALGLTSLSPNPNHVPQKSHPIYHHPFTFRGLSVIECNSDKLIQAPTTSLVLRRFSKFLFPIAIKVKCPCNSGLVHIDSRDQIRLWATDHFNEVTRVLRLGVITESSLTFIRVTAKSSIMLLAS